MRKVISSFKKSPLKTSILEKYTKEEFGVPLKLISDVKTRWNSLVDAIRRFLKLKASINNVYNEIGLEQIEETTFQKLQTVLSFVKPLEIAIKELCTDESNLCKAEGILIYLFKYYNEIEGGKDFFEMLKKRFLERRNIEIISALLFLQTGNF